MFNYLKNLIHFKIEYIIITRKPIVMGGIHSKKTISLKIEESDGDMKISTGEIKRVKKSKGKIVSRKPTSDNSIVVKYNDDIMSNFRQPDYVSSDVVIFGKMPTFKVRMNNGEIIF